MSYAHTTLRRYLRIAKETPLLRQCDQFMYTIGDLADITELSIDSINWYILKNMITEDHRIGHYRVFDDLAISRLNRIKELRRQTQENPDGFSLDQILVMLNDDPTYNTN